LVGTGSSRILLDITSLTTLTGANCDLRGSTNTGTCDFMGTVTAFGASVPGGIFRDTISGMLTRGPNPSTPQTPHPWLLETLTGALGNASGVVLPGSTLSVMDVQFCRTEQAAQGCGTIGANGRLRDGHGEATLFVKTIIPEPSTLGLFGTGLLGLAGLTRRKLKLGT